MNEYFLQLYCNIPGATRIKIKIYSNYQRILADRRKEFVMLYKRTACRTSKMKKISKMNNIYKKVSNIRIGN